MQGRWGKLACVGQLKYSGIFSLCNLIFPEIFQLPFIIAPSWWEGAPCLGGCSTDPWRHLEVFFLFGPRGTGKTTWLKHHLPDVLFINLLQSEFYNRLSANPGHIRQLIPPGYQDWVVIDEVQRIPALLNEVHDLIEADKLNFVLTGSSARTLRRRGVNLLAGRALTYHMHPLTVGEQEEAFNLNDSLRFGHLPARFSENNPRKYLQDYVQTYLREEVMQESLTRNIGHFSRFLEVASFSQGSAVNISAVAREAQIERSVAENYFSILEDLLIAVRLPVFSRKAKRKLIAQQKFYFLTWACFEPSDRWGLWTLRRSWTAHLWRRWCCRSCGRSTTTTTMATSFFSGEPGTTWKSISFSTGRSACWQ